ncbi:MAG: cation:H+ antiporter [Actinomycetota bacterium]|nr:sodium/calcium exchanger rane protein [Cryptosporangiaceae bacterium]MDQ1674928.1 cation:H+ antiporter [Actinomycetota bacterium]
MLHVVLLLGCAVVIYLACEWFVNAVEWLGVQLKFGPIAVGTILAAAGTALPESVVTLVAVLFGSKEHGSDIGVGAAMGGPLVVGTIAYGVTGAMILWRYRKKRVKALATVGGGDLAQSTEEGDGAAPGLDTVDTRRLARDQSWFLAIFVVKVALGLVAFAVKPWLGLLFFLAYAVYFWHETRSGDEQASGDDLEPLKIQPRRAVPAKLAVWTQTLLALAVVFAASQLFVAQLEWAGPALGLPSVVVALLLSPIATELPEVMNAIIWVRQGKTQLAVANISGAMMIQATVPSGLGLLFTPWHFTTAPLLAGIATIASVAYLLWVMRSGRITGGRLLAAGGFYLAFAAGLVLTL